MKTVSKLKKKVTNINDIFNPLPCYNVLIKMNGHIFQSLHFYKINPKLNTCFNCTKVFTLL